MIRTGDYVEILDGGLRGHRGKVIETRGPGGDGLGNQVIVNLPDYGAIRFHSFSVRVLSVLDMLAEI